MDQQGSHGIGSHLLRLPSRHILDKINYRTTVRIRHEDATPIGAQGTPYGLRQLSRIFMIEHLLISEPNQRVAHVFVDEGTGRVSNVHPT